MYGFDIHFCFTDFLISLTLCYFSVAMLVTVMILSKHLHMGRITSVASSMYGFDPCFFSIDFMICFTDFIFLSL